MKMSSECPDAASESNRYYCQMLRAERVGSDEEICSICPTLREKLTSFPRVGEALVFAAEAHGGQTRKGTDIPYLIHLIRTWEYVSRMTDAEDELVAALLHDVIEDTPVTFGELEAGFGRAVAELVADESEHKRREYPAGATWQIRKQETVERLRRWLGQEGKRAAMHVAFGDKLANLYSLMYEYRRIGDHIWKKFNQRDKSMHAWYYGEMGEIFADYFAGGVEAPMVAEYQVYYGEVFGEYVGSKVSYF